MDNGGPNEGPPRASGNSGNGNVVKRDSASNGNVVKRDSAGNGNAGRRDNTAAALADVTARLQAHSESLRRDILRLQKALADIDGAMATSLGNVDRMRSSTERLRQVFGPPKRPIRTPNVRWPAVNAAPQPPPVPDNRCGSERRCSLDRRRPAAEVSGLLRWIEGTSLDRRRGGERRRLSDRRLAEAGSSLTRLSAGQCAVATPSRPPAINPAINPANNIVSLAAVRAGRRRATKTKT